MDRKWGALGVVLLLCLLAAPSLVHADLANYNPFVSPVAYRILYDQGNGNNVNDPSVYGFLDTSITTSDKGQQSGTNLVYFGWCNDQAKGCSGDCVNKKQGVIVTYAYVNQSFSISDAISYISYPYARTYVYRLEAVDNTSALPAGYVASVPAFMQDEQAQDPNMFLFTPDTGTYDPVTGKPAPIIYTSQVSSLLTKTLAPFLATATGPGYAINPSQMHDDRGFYSPGSGLYLIITYFADKHWQCDSDSFSAAMSIVRNNDYGGAPVYYLSGRPMGGADVDNILTAIQNTHPTVAAQAAVITGILGSSDTSDGILDTLNATSSPYVHFTDEYRFVCDGLHGTADGNYWDYQNSPGHALSCCDADNIGGRSVNGSICNPDGWIQPKTTCDSYGGTWKDFNLASTDNVPVTDTAGCCGLPSRSGVCTGSYIPSCADYTLQTDCLDNAPNCELNTETYTVTLSQDDINYNNGCPTIVRNAACTGGDDAVSSVSADNYASCGSPLRNLGGRGGGPVGQSYIKSVTCQKFGTPLCQVNESNTASCGQFTDESSCSDAGCTWGTSADSYFKPYGYVSVNHQYLCANVSGIPNWLSVQSINGTYKIYTVNQSGGASADYIGNQPPKALAESSYCDSVSNILPANEKWSSCNASTWPLTQQLDPGLTFVSLLGHPVSACIPSHVTTDLDAAFTCTNENQNTSRILQCGPVERANGQPDNPTRQRSLGQSTETLTLTPPPSYAGYISRLTPPTGRTFVYAPDGDLNLSDWSDATALRFFLNTSDGRRVVVQNVTIEFYGSDGTVYNYSYPLPVNDLATNNIEAFSIPLKDFSGAKP